jgi:hypothetical protein
VRKGAITVGCPCFIFKSRFTIDKLGFSSHIHLRFGHLVWRFAVS